MLPRNYERNTLSLDFILGDETILRFSIDRGTRRRDNERNQAVSYACLTLRIRVYIYMSLAVTRL